MLERRKMSAFLFALPALVLYSLIVIYPLISGAYLSFTDSVGGPHADFVGFANFAQIGQDSRIWPSFVVTAEFALMSVIGGNALGLSLARSIYYRPRVRRIVTTLVLLPALVAPVMAGFIFSYILGPSGALNSFLADIGLRSLTQVWLGNPATALPAVAVVSMWSGAGFSTVIFLSSYLALDPELLDASMIDGATSWKKFRFIEWPLVSPALTVNLTLGIIGALRVFELPLVLTAGGPVNSTTSISMIIYKELFGQGNYGFAYGVALSVVLLLFVVVVASVLTTAMRFRERRMFS
ncbi:MAG TPA: sugar ABC transporter permease [Actinospica sp.]|jgi:raffinose/stachyose/melibiose transport system permease protein|nr:sugar ABC transporter permease [Actinospica sp.]